MHDSTLSMDISSQKSCLSMLQAVTIDPCICKHTNIIIVSMQCNLDYLLVLASSMWHVWSLSKAKNF